jgi:hypothetical protein
MRRSDKIGLSVAFSIGIGMMIVGIIRCIYIVTTAVRGDLTHTFPINLFLTVLEIQLAIITVCIPMLRPLWARYRARFRGYSIKESDKAPSAGDFRRSLPNGTFGGSGKKGSKGSRPDPDASLLGTTFELNNLTETTNVKGTDIDGRRISMISEGQITDAGSETRLDANRKYPDGVTGKDAWKVSVV